MTDTTSPRLDATDPTLEALRAAGVEAWCVGLAQTTARLQYELAETRAELRQLREAGPIGLGPLADDPVPIPEVRCRRLVVVDDSNAERIVAMTYADGRADLQVHDGDRSSIAGLMSMHEETEDPCAAVYVIHLNTEDIMLASGEGGGTIHAENATIIARRLTVNRDSRYPA